MPIGRSGRHARPQDRLSRMQQDSEADEYTMARSMRLGFHTLSPHSLDHDSSYPEEDSLSGTPARVADYGPLVYSGSRQE